MKYYRAELVYDEPADIENPQRHIPKAIRLVNPENGDSFEIPGVRDVSIHWSPREVRVLRVEMIVSGLDEVVEPRKGAR